MKIKTLSIAVAAALGVLLCLPSSVRGAELTQANGSTGNIFGESTSLSGGIGLVGATLAGFNNEGTVYVFRDLHTATGDINEQVKLIASDAAENDRFGITVSISGTIGLVGANLDDSASNFDQGSAYVFRNLDTATFAITQNVKLLASDGVNRDAFGSSVSLSGTVALVGAPRHRVQTTSEGAAYVFRNLGTATGTINQNAKLIASDHAPIDSFGGSVSISGSTGLVGAPFDTVGANNNQGSAYVFRNLATATGTITQSAKLIPSDGTSQDRFGDAVSLSGNIGLVGAPSHSHLTGYNGAAYVFRSLDTTTGTITQSVKLMASDGASDDRFGESVSLSGGIGLVGARADDVEINSDQGSAYIFRDLERATGTITQNVKLTAADGAMNDSFGDALSLDGDHFIIGAPGQNGRQGKAYSGSVSAFTTLDVGNSSRSISGLDFTSRNDWIIGDHTPGNDLSQIEGSATVTAPGKAIYLGKNAGSNSNVLEVNGSIIANDLYIGNVSGSILNAFILNSAPAIAALNVPNLHLAPGNFLLVQGDFTTTAEVLAALGSNHLQTWTGSTWENVTPANASGRVVFNQESGYGRLAAVGSVLIASGDLNFGTVLVGQAAQRTLNLHNKGAEAINVSGLSLPAGYSGNFTGTIAPNTIQQVIIQLAPTAGIAYNGTLTVHSNVLSGTTSLAITGQGAYSIAVRAQPSLRGTVSGAGNYTLGARVTVVAKAKRGRSFVAWKEGRRIVSTKTRYSFTVTRSRNLVATFR
ncbi:MAG TPA: hypothetical protein VF585_04425 [Chthoniobacterales bacterium]|jgi:hypothetical protein